MSQLAYSAALERVCTTLNEGLVRQFALDHYPELEKVDKDLVAIRNKLMANIDKVRASGVLFCVLFVCFAVVLTNIVVDNRKKQRA